jgi:predicted O-linked N-acetylglucosamine transferase (SPINDLY family)
MLGWLKRVLRDAPAAATDAAPAALQDAARTRASEPPPLSPAQDAEAELQRGNRFLDEGRLEDAIGAYERSAALAPGVASMVNLGFALKEAGRLQDARARLSQAVALDATQFDAHYLLGAVALASGEAAAAVRHLKDALALQPDSDVAALDLCAALRLAGQPEAALDAARTAAARHPQLADFHFMLGNLLSARPAKAARREAIDCYRQALALRPGHPETLYNLSLALQSAGQLDEAQAALAQAASAHAPDARILSALASVLIAQGRPADAARHAAKAVALAPGDADAHNMQGNVSLAQGRPDAAQACYREALRLEPRHAQAHNNLGMALMALGRLADAEASFRQSLALAPADAGTLNNLGNLLQRRDRYTEAAAVYREALALDPEHADAWSNLAGALQACGDHVEAIDGWRRALVIAPDFFSAWSNLLFGLSYLPSCTPEAYLAEARAYGEAVAARAHAGTGEAQDGAVPARVDAARPPGASQASSPTSAHAASLAGGQSPRRLRLGLVSGDLREHPVGFFLEGVLAYLPAERFALHAYLTSTRSDRLTERLRPRFAGWHSLVGLSDAAAAQQVRDDGIDILIDLAGHTADNRLPLFAWHAAPVQLSWPGYFASTGVPGMDWLLADAVTVPPGHEAHFSERIHRLPLTRLCFTAPADAQAVPVSPLPALTRGHLTFGCFQNMTKLNDAVFSLWSRVLTRLPDARLRLQSRQMADAALRERVLAAFARRGVSAGRIDLVGPTSREVYLAAHAEVDIMLDTFPFTGGTTTCESLWMGVPTVTLTGQTLLARQGMSLLTAAGLPDWIAADADAYVERVAAAAADLPALAALRGGLRAQVLASPLFDARRFAADFEAALLAMSHEQDAATSRP